jgi:hypothetical protein
MLSNEYLALQLEKSRRQEAEGDRRHDLLNFLIREFKGEMRKGAEDRNRRTQK